jgi:hypothetical protein
MNTFFNMHIEFKLICAESIDETINEIRNTDINKKINVRGNTEQYAAVALLHYHPHIKGRARRSSRFINSKFNSIDY